MDLFSQPEPIQLTATRNKNGGQANLDENRAHFQSQAEKVLKHLLDGEWIDGDRMRNLYNIHDIRPRVAKLRKIYDMEFEIIKGANGLKRWRIIPERLKEYKDGSTH